VAAARALTGLAGSAGVGMASLIGARGPGPEMVAVDTALASASAGINATPIASAAPTTIRNLITTPRRWSRASRLRDDGVEAQDIGPNQLAALGPGWHWRI